MDTLRGATRALAEKQAEQFLGYFDRQMPGFPELQLNIAALVAAQGASSTIEIVTDSGDDQKRMMQIDWLLRAGAAPPKRAVLKIALERREGKWMITALDPVSFFAPNR
jgi:hypothetical protein